MRLVYSLVVLALLVLVVGLFLGWFEFSKTRDVDGDTTIKMKVNKDKIEGDASKAIDEVQDLGDKVKKKLKEN